MDWKLLRGLGLFVTFCGWMYTMMYIGGKMTL